MPRVPTYARLDCLQTGMAAHDTYVAYGWHTRLAQPFFLSARAKVWRCTMRLHSTFVGEFYYFDLHKATPAGKPTGAPIAQTSVTPQTSKSYMPGTYKRFDFDAMPMLEPGYYALVASYPDDISTTVIRAIAKQDPKNYTHGTTHRSTDAGATWTAVPDTNLIFQVWGWWEDPGAAPPVEDGNWYLTDVATMWTQTGKLIVLTTNRRCTMVMRWTNTKPNRRAVNRIVRGAIVCRFLNQELTNYHDIIQEEPNDTYIHSFIIDPWPYCETKYFFFFGLVAMELMPSATPIFGIHRDSHLEAFTFREIFDWPQYRCTKSLPFTEQFTGKVPELGVEYQIFKELYSW